MIARIYLPLFLLILLTDAYIYRQMIRPRWRSRWVAVLWFTVTAVMIAVASDLSTSSDFLPENATPTLIFLFVLGVLYMPKALIAGGHLVGRAIVKFTGHRRALSSLPRWGACIGALFGLAGIYILVYGILVEFNKIDVRRVDYTSPDLPAAFDGYRIALFSDAHVGNYPPGEGTVLAAAVDSMLSMHADAIFFLGDIQNVRPSEISVHTDLLGRLQAPDGVYAILGNHDYAHYIEGTAKEKLGIEAMTKRLLRGMGWNLLLNEHVMLHHGGDSIALAGMEGNEGRGEDHSFPIWEKTVEGIGDSLFTIMLVHNPKCWKKYVVPNDLAALTLSGHTHGGQVKVLGFSTTTLLYDEDDGMYEHKGKHLFVSKGIGALIPMRFGVTGEVVQLTLHKKETTHQKQ